MKPIGQILDEIGWPQKLRALAERVERNVPNHTDPEAFHAEKSEIVSELREVSREAQEARG
jgi:hypothetical protein